MAIAGILGRNLNHTGDDVVSHDLFNRGFFAFGRAVSFCSLRKLKNKTSHHLVRGFVLLLRKKITASSHC